MKQYLIFEAESLSFGLESLYVKEIFPLPELQPIAEAPGDVIGLLNVRSRLTPIIHLAKRLGVAKPSCQLQDSVILTEWQGLQVGFVVNQVHDVQDISDGVIFDPPNLERDQYINTALVHSFAQLDDKLLAILHPESLIRQAEDVAVVAWEAELSQYSEGKEDEDFEGEIQKYQDFYALCGDLTPLKRQIFHQRATELKTPLESYDIADLEAITVISIGEEYFGIELNQVREFIHVPKLTRIPCAPGHIVGNFNLRGEIITLMDLRASLEIEETQPCPKAVILDVARQRIGVGVSEVYDVLYLGQDDYLEFPVTVSADHQRFLAGAFEYQGQVVRLIRLSALLDQLYPQTALAA